MHFLKVLLYLTFLVTCYSAAVYRNKVGLHTAHATKEKKITERSLKAQVEETAPLIRTIREVANKNDPPQSDDREIETQLTRMDDWVIPKPDWKLAFMKWKSTWPIHIYIFSGLFILAALLVTTIRCYVYWQEGPSKRELFAEVLTTLVFLFSLLRATSLLADAYGHKQRTTYGVTHFIWSMATPCLTASYAVLLMAILDSTKMSLLPEAAQRWRSLVGVTGIHFVVVILGDVVLLSAPGAKIVYVICQFLSTVWGLIVSIGYAFLGLKLYYNFWSMATVKNAAPEPRIWRLFLLICITALVCSTVSLSQLYFLFSNFGPLSKENPADAWPWLRLQNLLRFGEIVSCFLISTELFVVLFCDDPINELSLNSSNSGSNSRCSDSRRSSARFGGSTDRNLYTSHLLD